jgi:tetratricopeptide (TPR) repeat protein
MAEQIPDNVALNLTGLFYRNLKLGFPIDLSLNRARQGLISAYGSHQFYWALPVLYLHPEFDGYLLAGDRSRENPADRFSLLPSAMPPTLSRSAVTRDLPRDLPQLPAKQPVRSSDETWSPVRAIAAREGLEILDDESRAEQSDRRAIAEVMQQLSPQAAQPQMQSEASLQAPERRPAAVQTVGTDAVPVTQPLQQKRRSKRRWARFLFLPALGALGVGVAFAGLHLLPQQTWQLPPWLGGPTSSSVETPPILIDPSETNEELRAGAKDFFEKRQIDQGIEAVKALLDRNALKEASAALAAVPDDFRDAPEINFLRGRLAWQGMKAQDGVHTVEQARDFWQKAVKDQPDNLEYQEALGFTYYADDDLETALKIWSDANSTLMDDNKAALNFRAAIAVALKRDAANRPPDQQSAYLLTAVQNYQNVINRDPNGFSPASLRQNWLWTEAAVKDWESLAGAANNPSKPTASPAPQPSSQPSGSPAKAAS